MHTSLLPRLACPECYKALRLCAVGALPAVAAALAWEGALTCVSCEAKYKIEQGVPLLLRSSRKAQLSLFGASYAALRRREGWSVDSPSYYKALPFQDTTGRHSKEWRIRAYSFGRLLRRVSDLAKGRSLRVVDLGAGVGWLAARLSEAGHSCLAIDIDAGQDGLLAGRHLRSDGVDFGCVQGELLYPPLAEQKADLIVINAALHYTTEHSKIFAVLYRLLAPGGALAIIDSPTYPDPRARDLALEASARYYRKERAAELAYTYRGLVREELRDALSAFRSVEHEVTYAPSAAQSLLGRLRHGYQPARFELFWAKKH